jgi:hypothetical protein
MTINWIPGSNDQDASAREPRTSKLVAVELSSDRHPPTRVVVRNLSSHGVGARGDIDLLPCERVCLHLPGGGKIAGTVRWVRKGTFGIALDERVPAQFLQAKAGSAADIVTRDAQVGFQPMRHKVEASGRSGFQRTHRDEVLRQSSWTEGY